MQEISQVKIVPATETTLPPTLTPSPSPSPTSTSTPTATPTITSSPTETPDRKATQLANATITAEAINASILKYLEPYELDLDNGKLVYYEPDALIYTINENKYFSMSDPVDMNQKVKNFIFKTEIIWDADEHAEYSGCGLMFRAGDNPSEDPFYVLSFYLKASFLARAAYGIEYWDNGYFKSRVTPDYMLSRDISNVRNEVNSMVILVEGSTLTLYNNGVRLGRYLISDGEPGWLNYYIINNGKETTCIYQNTWILELE